MIEVFEIWYAERTGRWGTTIKPQGKDPIHFTSEMRQQAFARAVYVALAYDPAFAPDEIMEN